jgi:hypothetical protein
LGFLFALFLRRKQQERLSDMAGYKSAKARKVAQKWLKEAASSVDDPDHFYAALIKALESYVSDKFGLSRSDLSKPSIRETFRSRNMPELGNRMVELISWCEMARFSSKGAEVATVKLKEAQELITHIEQSK